MKPVNENLHDRFYEESVEGFDAVMERLMKVLGESAYGSFAMSLDVSENTIKTWRRRGAVSLKYLQGFAARHGVALDYLLRGENANTVTGPLSDDERLMLERYRASPRDLRDAALRVLLGGGDPPSPKNKKVKQTVSGTANQVVGINQGGVSHGEARGRSGSKRKG